MAHQVFSMVICLLTSDIDTESLHTMGKTSTKTIKQKALEALKRKRSMRGVTTSSPAPSIENSQQDDSLDDGEDDNLEEVDDIVNSVAQTHDDNDEFIVEDDKIGVPVELPLEFSHYSSMKTKDLFKFVVEWMVQRKLNPAFNMDDQVYKLSFNRIDDVVKGLGGSKFTSSAWVPTFLKSLRARPVLASHHFVNDNMLRDHCDACNRSNHPATYEVRFSGNTYDRETLEEDSENKDEDEDTDEEARGSATVPAAGVRYYLGRFCMQNAKTAHALTHWRFHLNEWVVDYLDAEGYSTPEKIVERDGWSTKKRRRYANKVVDSMENTGEIKRLHRDFRHEIEDAQNKKVRDSPSPGADMC